MSTLGSALAVAGAAVTIAVVIVAVALVYLPLRTGEAGAAEEETAPTRRRDFPALARAAWPLAFLPFVAAILAAVVLVVGIGLTVFFGDPRGIVLAFTRAADVVAWEFEDLFLPRGPRTRVAVNYAIAAAVYLLVGGLLARWLRGLAKPPEVPTRREQARRAREARKARKAQKAEEAREARQFRKARPTREGQKAGEAHEEDGEARIDGDAWEARVRRDEGDEGKRPERPRW